MNEEHLDVCKSSVERPEKGICSPPKRVDAFLLSNKNVNVPTFPFVLTFIYLY